MQEDPEQLQKQADLLAVEILNKQRLIETFQNEDPTGQVHQYHVKDLEDEIADLKRKLDNLTGEGISPKEPAGL